MVKTYSVKKSDITRQWHVLDATDQILGRLASKAAGLLLGKHKPMFVRNLDTGDYVVITNAKKIRFTGNKAEQKFYYRHSGYPGGFKVTSLEAMMETHPTRVLEHAVKGMLPHNRLGDKMLKKLRVYAGGAPADLTQIQPKKEAKKEAPPKETKKMAPRKPRAKKTAPVETKEVNEAQSKNQGDKK